MQEASERWQIDGTIIRPAKLITEVQGTSEEFNHFAQSLELEGQFRRWVSPKIVPEPYNLFELVTGTAGSSNARFETCICQFNVTSGSWPLFAMNAHIAYDDDASYLVSFYVRVPFKI